MKTVILAAFLAVVAALLATFAVTAPFPAGSRTRTNIVAQCPSDVRRDVEREDADKRNQITRNDDLPVCDRR